jgi:two-component system sensor histidine kinase SenX3
VEPLLALLAGVVIGLLLALTVVRTRMRPVDEGGAARGVDLLVDRADSDAALTRRLVDLMDTAVVLLGPDDAVVLANPSARALGILRGDRLVVPGGL